MISTNQHQLAMNILSDDFAGIHNSLKILKKNELDFEMKDNLVWDAPKKIYTPLGVLCQKVCNRKDIRFNFEALEERKKCIEKLVKKGADIRKSYGEDASPFQIITTSFEEIQDMNKREWKNYESTILGPLYQTFIQK